MTISFNLGKFAQNLQRVGAGMLGNGLFLAASREIQHGGFWGPGMGGFYGGSIWGCGGGMMGCTPPMNIFHPMYSSMNYNPYMAQAGIDQAAAYGHALAEQALAQSNQLVSGSQQTTEADNADGAGGTEETSAEVEASNEFTTKMQNGEDFQFVSNGWKNLLNKPNRTEEESKELKEAYNQSIAYAGEAHIKNIDKEYGNGDGKVTVEEFIESLAKENQGIDKAQLEQAAKTLDLDGDQKISGQEMSALMAFLDELGKEDRRDGVISAEDYGFVMNTLTSPDLSEGYKENLNTIKDGLFGKE